MKDPAQPCPSHVFLPFQNHWIWVRSSPAGWIPRPGLGLPWPRVPKLHDVPFVLNLTLVLGPSSALWAFITFPSFDIFFHGCSWYLPILKFLIIVDIFLFLPRTSSEGHFQRIGGFSKKSAYRAELSYNLTNLPEVFIVVSCSNARTPCYFNVSSVTICVVGPHCSPRNMCNLTA